VANAAAPVEVDIAAVHAAWGSPLTIEGLKITEKGNPDSNQQTDPSSSAGKAGTDGLLLDAESIRTSATLWQILTTSETDVIVTRPRVNATFNEQGVLRVAQALEDAGLSPAPHDIEQVDQAWDSAHAAAAAQHGGGAARSTSSTASSTRGAEPTVGSDRAAASARVSRPRLQLPSSLQRIAAAVPFSGEVRSGKVHVAMADGTLLAPKEFQ